MFMNAIRSELNRIVSDEEVITEKVIKSRVKVAILILKINSITHKLFHM